MGRPSQYRDDFVTKAGELARRGATDIELADALDVDVRTLYRWKNEKEEFRQALKAGKDEADARVERSLFQRAIGYEQDSVKIFMPAGASEPVFAKFREVIAPDTTACIFWLKNRKRDEWRDKIDHEHSGEVVGLVSLDL